MKDFESSVESFIDSTELTGGWNGLLLLIPLSIVAAAALVGLLAAQSGSASRMVDTASIGIETHAPAIAAVD